jgi:hypothetical protein
MKRTAEVIGVAFLAGSAFVGTRSDAKGDTGSLQVVKPVPSGFEPQKTLDVSSDKGSFTLTLPEISKAAKDRIAPSSTFEVGENFQDYNALNSFLTYIKEPKNNGSYVIYDSVTKALKLVDPKFAPGGDKIASMADGVRVYYDPNRIDPTDGAKRPGAITEFVFYSFAGSIELASQENLEGTAITKFTDEDGKVVRIEVRKAEEKPQG